MFIKLSSLGDKGSLSDRIPELPALIVGRVADKDALDHVPAQLVAFVTLNMGISSAAPNAQMRERDLASCQTTVHEEWSRAI